jgi:hypothetical protein
MPSASLLCCLALLVLRACRVCLLRRSGQVPAVAGPGDAQRSQQGQDGHCAAAAGQGLRSRCVRL